ncbi:MAG: MBL fold metallo-hydrolase [Armatimonadetes bacterium]|nr:MBL fold metallo-hydrolase [Armatimonadota bacterium]
MIGCKCHVCTSDDPRNRRTRTSALVEFAGKHILIDTTLELRIQCLANQVERVDAVLFTHAHADHIFGLDDIRRFNEIQRFSIPCYGSGDTLATIRQAFDYIFIRTQEGGGKPKIDLIEVSGPFAAAGVPIIPIPVLHGRLPVFGYRIGDLAYITDCSKIPEESLELLRGLDVLVLGVLRTRPHPTHFNLSQGVATALSLAPKWTYFVHIAHGLDHSHTNRQLPSGIELAHDGLVIAAV